MSNDPNDPNNGGYTPPPGFAPPHGQPAQPAQPAGFGQPPAQPQGFGQPAPQEPPAAQPGFGQPTQPAGGFGQTPAPGFGQTPAPGFGQPQAPGFGQPQAPGFGQTPPPGGAMMAPQPPGGFGAGGPGQPGGGYGAPPGGGDRPTGLKTAAVVLLIVGSVLSVAGLVPCLGLLNWLAIPTNIAMAIVGVVGLVIGPKQPDGKAYDFGLHVAAIVVGLVLAAMSFIRCLAGGGVV